MQFVAENIGAEAIRKFEIAGVDTYDRPVNGRKGVDTIGFDLYPHQSTAGVIGGSAIVGNAGAQLLKSYTLTVSAITYADGKTWPRGH